MSGSEAPTPATSDFMASRSAALPLPFGAFASACMAASMPARTPATGGGGLGLHLLLAGHGLGRGRVRGGLGRRGELGRLRVRARQGELLGLGLQLGLERGRSRLGGGERGRSVVGGLGGLGRFQRGRRCVQGLGRLLGTGDGKKGHAREHGKNRNPLHRCESDRPRDRAAGLQFVSAFWDPPASAADDGGPEPQDEPCASPYVTRGRKARDRLPPAQSIRLSCSSTGGYMPTIFGRSYGRERAPAAWEG